MLIYLLSICGAVLNAIRGGTPFSAKWLQPLVFGITFGLVSWHFKTMPQDCMLHHLLQDWSYLIAALISGVAMWAGAQSGGWGAYVGAIIDRRTPHAEVAWIDWCIQKLEPYPILWGTAGMTLRLMQWGLLLSLVTVSWLPLWLSGTGGVIYLTCGRFGRWVKQNLGWFRNDIGWVWAEIVFGAVVWAACFYTIL